MPFKWYGDTVENMVGKKEHDWVTKLVIMGEGKTKTNITDQGRIDTGRMRADITHEVHPTKPVGRFGGNTHYLPYQENGTLNEDGTQRIAPGFFLRDALTYVKANAEKVKL